MKRALGFTCICLLSASSLFSQDKSKETNSEIEFYSKSAIGMLNYAFLLSQSTQDPDKSDYEQSLVANIFEYWYLKTNNKISENKSYEKTAAHLLMRAKAVRPEILEDPLGRINPKASKRSIGGGGIGIVINDGNYDRLRKEFIDYIRNLDGLNERPK